MTQLQLSNESGISRVRISFAECGYIRLNPAEEQALKRAMAREIERRVSLLQRELATA